MSTRSNQSKLPRLALLFLPIALLRRSQVTGIAGVFRHNNPLKITPEHKRGLKRSSDIIYPQLDCGRQIRGGLISTAEAIKGHIYLCLQTGHTYLLSATQKICCLSVRRSSPNSVASDMKQQNWFHLLMLPS